MGRLQTDVARRKKNIVPPLLTPQKNERNRLSLRMHVKGRGTAARKIIDICYLYCGGGRGGISVKIIMLSCRCGTPSVIGAKEKLYRSLILHRCHLPLTSPSSMRGGGLCLPCPPWDFKLFVKLKFVIPFLKFFGVQNLFFKKGFA